MAAFLSRRGRNVTIVSVTKRRRSGLSYGVQARNRSQPLHQLPLKDLGSLVAVTGTGEVEGSHHDVFHFKARMDELRSIKAAQQQPGGEQQNHACRDLRGHESAPQQSTASGTLLGFSTSFLHRQTKVHARRTESGHEAECNSCKQTRQKRKGQDASVWADIEHERDARREMGL